MSKTLLAAAALALATLPLAAQQAPVVPASELEAAVVARAGRDDANRAAVRRFLQHQEVRVTAERMGVRTSDLETAVATLDGQALQDLADRTRAAEGDLAGGANIVITSTIVIIALLILILILLID
jgi:hypothetical protein